MTKMILQRLVLLISLLAIATGCASKKARIFGNDLPTMQAIHDEKFQTQRERPAIDNPRPLERTAPSKNSRFDWLTNPTLHVYVFEHLSPTGLPVPGYTTFFKLYTSDHIALPHERSEW